MGNSTVYIDCILPVPLNQHFTYHVPERFNDKIIVGSRVIVQFGTRKFHSALVTKIHTEKPAYETKPVETVLDDQPIVNELSFRFWQWMADYYCCPIGDVMKAALPAGLKLESQTSVYLNEEWVETERLTDYEEMVYQFLCENKTATIQQINLLTKKTNAYQVIKTLLQKEAISVDEKVVEKYQPKTVAHIKISRAVVTDDDFNRAFESLKRSKKQLDFLMFLLSELHFFSAQKISMLPKKDLIQKGNFSEQIVRGLVEKGFIELVEVEVTRLSETNSILKKLPVLNPYQEQALNTIYQQFIAQNVVLLHGVTASGKTEIYIRMIADQLRAGKQVLYLLPEIALTSQIIERLKAVFGDKAGIYHSKFNDSERVEIWNKVLDFDKETGKGYQLVLGARSSIFLPFKNLGLIIVDEENENSFKQFDPSPRYNARDAAVMLGQFYSAKVLLGTATPSFETYSNAKGGKYGYVQLNQRHFDVAKPEIIVADIADATKRKQMKSLFTPTLLKEISDALANKEQVILFQNRRGFAPYLQCKDCGWIPTCKHCDVSLTYHKFHNNLLCHYCGFTLKMANSCSSCHSTNMQTKGFGTEKIEDELKIFFPETTFDRLDFDTTRKKFGHETILQKFSEEKTQVLVGTQMVTKGLDFEHVRVVGILDADSLLNFPDFRSHERAFQLMMQVSGRAGRKNSRGKVVIQTYQPSHPVILQIIEGNFEQLFNVSMQERKLFQYPPWYRLIYITVKHKNIDRAKLASNQLVVELKKMEELTVLGPEFPIIARIQQYYQLMIRIKIPRTLPPAPLKKLLIAAIDKVKHFENNGSVQFSIDVDPQ